MIKRMSPKHTGRYEFISEKTKRKPFNFKKAVMHLLGTIGVACLFGLVVSLVIAYVLPRLNEYTEKKEQVDFVIETNDEVENKTGMEAPVETEEKLSLSDMQRLSYQMYSVADSANASIVRIKSGSENIVQGNLANNSLSTGIIISRLKNDLLVLTEQGVLKGIKNVTIEFFNGDTAYGTVQSYNEELEMGVISVNISKLPAVSKKAFTVAEFGNSRNVAEGMLVAAVGNPLGYPYSSTTGCVTGLDGKVEYTDREYSIITTNMPGKTYSRGFLLDWNGRVMGLLTHKADEVGEVDMLSAIPISDIKDEIEALVNEEPQAYLGLSVCSLSEDTEDDYKIPQGAYVKDVQAGSPGVRAGLQTGDIIVQMGDTQIDDAEDYQNCLEAHAPEDQLVVIVMRYSQKSYQRVTCKVILEGR